MKLSEFFTNKFKKKLTGRLSLKEQIFLVQRLSFLIKSGVPILECLKMMRKFRSKSKTRIFDEIIGDVSNGQSLSKSFQKFSHIFNPFFINIIKVGEKAGILHENLGYLAEELRKRRDLRNKLIGSLIYPIFIMLATLGIILLLLVFVFPKVLPIFKSLNMELPATTRLLIAITDFIKAYGTYIGISFFLLASVFILLMKKIPKFRIKIQIFVLKIPFAGKMIKSYQLANFCRTFSLLIKSGVSMSEITNILAESTPNLVYKREIERLGESISKGKSIYSELEKRPRLFPEITTQMIATGEKSGKLSDSLSYLSELYEKEFDDLTKNLSASLEPFLMIFMGLIVGFIAISIIVPIYNVTQHLSPK